VPVSRISSKLLFTLSTRRAVCSVMLCLGRNPNCLSHSSPRSFTSRRTLVSRIISEFASSQTYGFVGRRQRGVHSRLQYGYLRTCIHADGKYWLRSAALNTFVGKNFARLSSVSTLFGIPFAPGTLPTLSPPDGL
jgi:hypothetical protein